jgi:predicted GIY-YIG superfamily endonuclease
MSSKTYLYWIHYPDHTDPTTEGYIGITCNTKERFQVHKRTFKHYFDNGATISILNEFDSRDAAHVVEADYRPVANIGWNTYSGAVNRLNNRPGVSTTYNASLGTKLVNIRIEPQLWDNFKDNCKRLGVSASERMRQLMEQELETDYSQYEFDF